MASVKIRELPYLSDSSAYYQAIRDLPSPVWLDSGRPHGPFGRYDILSAQPLTTLTTSGGETRIENRASASVSNANPFDLVAAALGEVKVDAEPDLPFCGGAVGYFGYHLQRHLEPALPTIPRDIPLPDMAIGIYHWAIVQDHEKREAFLLALPTCPSPLFNEAIRRARSAAAKGISPLDNFGSFSFQISGLYSNFDSGAHREKLARIQDYIQAGDCYQVNFAQRFSSHFQGDPFAAFRHLRRLLPSPYGAFMELPEGAVLSHSPEQFLRLTGSAVETRPIKGTAPRHPEPQQDRANAEQLCHSGKDRAENLMIVDLLRNDLGKSCRFGSVQAPRLFELQSYANVHHLVSTIRGQLKPECSATDLLKGCFPGGSITGAPKFRAMEIIAELENCDRSVYCGSIGYLSANGNMDTNIAIRTLVCSEDRMYCWGGGGIVADSDPDAEYAESVAKIRILLEGLGGKL